MCKVSNAESNSTKNIPEDRLHQVDPNYGHFSCITRDCKKCGPEVVLMSILEQNPGILDCDSEVSWNCWEWVPKKNSTSKRLDIITKHGKKSELIDLYLSDLKEMSYHLFSCHWNYSQFIFYKENLKPGQLLQVLDLGQSYMNVYQDEPQGVHWDHTQTVLHPIVNYCLDDTGKLVTEEHLMISDDLKHDKFVVRQFEKESLAKLKEKGFIPEQIIQFCDNCAGQYKSKGPFQFILDAGIPTLRMFFGAHHSKGPADGVVGRIKGAAKRDVRDRKVIIRNAQDFAKYCMEKFADNSYKADSQVKQYFIQEFFFVTDIPREEEIVAVTAPHTRSFHSI